MALTRRGARRPAPDCSRWPGGISPMDALYIALETPTKGKCSIHCVCVFSVYVVQLAVPKDRSPLITEPDEATKGLVYLQTADY